MAKEYLGDSVYIDFDGYDFILTTSNGIKDTNTIYLDPGLIDVIVDYVKRATSENT